MVSSGIILCNELPVRVGCEVHACAQVLHGVSGGRPPLAQPGWLSTTKLLAKLTHHVSSALAKPISHALLDLSEVIGHCNVLGRKFNTQLTDTSS